VLGAIAELERNLIKDGVHRAQKQGKQLGRPKRIFDTSTEKGNLRKPWT
jgi:DNA invertase Pin-like site-specific DNA recombinase